MNVMQPKKGPAWQNEVLPQPPVVPQPIEDLKDSLEESQAPGPLSDLEWMKQHMSNNVDVEERVFEQSDDETGEVKPQVCLILSTSLFFQFMFSRKFQLRMRPSRRTRQRRRFSKLHACSFEIYHFPVPSKNLQIFLDLSAICHR